MGNIKLFTHTDLDGVGNAILANRFFGHTNVDISYCQAGKLDEELNNFIKGDGFNEYSKIFITDISPKNKELVENLDFYNQVYDSLRLFDHHKTAEWLNKYSWAEVHETVNGKLECGTSLFHKYLNSIKPMTKEEQFVEHVKQFDVWLWELSGDTFAKDLNTLLNLLGRDKFVERFSKSIVCCFTEYEQLLVDVDNRTYNNYLKKKVNSVIERSETLPDGRKYTFGVIIADTYISQLGNDIASLNPHLDFITIVNGNNNKLSFRTKKDDIDVSEIAKMFNGGGHPKASGADIPEDKLHDMYKILFKF